MAAASRKMLWHRSSLAAAAAAAAARNCNLSLSAARPLFSNNSCWFRRFYFTNTDLIKRDDPYAPLGLTWGATLTDIKEAYRQRARELHPDVSHLPPQEALRQFQVVQRAYQKLIRKRNGNHSKDEENDHDEEWSFAVWRSADVIAQERTDVAGVQRKRPARPAQKKTNWGPAALGHPQGGGVKQRRGEYLADNNNNNNNNNKKRSSSSTVGTGRNKWVTTPRELPPWNPQATTTTTTKK